MNVPTEAEIRQEILAAALRGAPAGEGYTLQELRTLTGLSDVRARKAMRTLIETGRVEPVTLYRKDLAQRNSAVIGYRFL